MDSKSLSRLRFERLAWVAVFLTRAAIADGLAQPGALEIVDGPAASGASVASDSQVISDAEVQPLGDGASTDPIISAAQQRESLPLGLPRGPAAADSTKSVADPGQPEWVMQTVGALGVVLSLILVGRYGVSKLTGRVSGSNGHPALEVLGRVGIAPRQQVLLLRLGHRVLVVGESSGGLRTLADLTDPEEVSSVLAASASSKSSSITRGFNDLISRFTSDYQDKPGSALRGDDAGDDRYERAQQGVHGLLSKLRSKNREEGTLE